MNSLYLRSIRIKNEENGEACYALDLPVIRGIRKAGEFEFEGPVTFFVGENGSGKSTLLEGIAVACGFNPEGGTKNFNFSTEETHSPLHRYITLVRGVKRPKDGFFLRAESFYNVATEIDQMDREDSGAVPLIDSYGGTSLHRQSHGESFMALVLNRFGGNGLYILDEPEAALSPSRQFSLLAAIHTLVKKDSQLIIATHSPVLLAYPGADIYVFGDGGMVKTPYRETEHYSLTRSFLNNPERVLSILFED